MQYFPMFLDMTGRTVVLAGGGEQIAQKCRLLKRTTASLVVMSEELNPELRRLVEAGGASHVAEDLDVEAVASAHYVFIATEDEDLDLEIAEHARAAHALVNMVDKPDQCDMIFPAIVDRDPVVAAIGTEGAAPVVAKAAKTLLESALSPRLGAFVRMLAARRAIIADKVAPSERLALWRWATEDDPWRLWLEEREAEAAAMVDEAIEAGAAPAAGVGAIAMISTPHEADLISMRAVQRLQQAATIVHGAGADIALLDYARRDAERVEATGCPRGGDMTAFAELAKKGPLVILCDEACAAHGLLEGAERL